VGLKLPTDVRADGEEVGYRRTLVGLKHLDASLIGQVFERYRRTLVGLKQLELDGCRIGVLVTDEPSWG